MSKGSHRLLRVGWAALACLAAAPAHSQPRLLVFSKTDGFRHAVIPNAKAALLQMAKAEGFVMDTTEDSKAFTAANLSRYQAVFFNHCIGNVLDAEQQTAFQAYIRKGGGFAGLHASSAVETDWPWYRDLVGAYFKDHSPVVTGTLKVEDRNHPSTASLPATWTRKEEWYNFDANPRAKVKVLLTVDEKTYAGGTMGADHPMAWYHDFEGGRAWYSALGHAPESYTEAHFLAHLKGGVEYAMALKPTRVILLKDASSSSGPRLRPWRPSPGILAYPAPSGRWHRPDGSLYPLMR